MRPRTVRQAVPIDFLWAAAVPANVMKLLTLTYKYSLVKNKQKSSKTIKFYLKNLPFMKKYDIMVVTNDSEK